LTLKFAVYGYSFSLKSNLKTKIFRKCGFILWKWYYTVFVVDQRRASTASCGYFFGGSGSSTNTRIHLGYDTDTAVTFRQFNNDYNALGSVPAYSSPIPLIHAFLFNSSSGKTYYLNGISKTLTSVSTPTAVGTQGVTSQAGAVIGSLGGGCYYNGDIAEIIVFNRALKGTEIKDINQYLGKKWGIIVN
jgi:hypothetical protein